MDDAMSAIRRAIVDEAGWRNEISPRQSREPPANKRGRNRTPEAGLLSREATAAVGSAFNTLTETVKKHEPTLEDVVRETLRPTLKSWLDENLPQRGRADGSRRRSNGSLADADAHVPQLNLGITARLPIVSQLPLRLSRR